MAWVVTPAMKSQRNAFNERFPNRRKSSDGSIGDDKHKLSSSSHNPDDTPGSKSEYTDVDSKQEVRGLDTDENLNDSDFDMFDVVNAILATPADLKRCKYLIYKQTIWSRNTNWQPRKYTGDYHNHLHCSGDPVFDEDGSPWLSILNLGKGEEDMTPDEKGLLGNIERIVSAMCTRLMPERGPGETEDRTEIVLVQPWDKNIPTVPNPVDWLIKQFAEVDGVEQEDVEELLRSALSGAQITLTMKKEEE